MQMHVLLLEKWWYA